MSARPRRLSAVVVVRRSFQGASRTHSPTRERALVLSLPAEGLRPNWPRFHRWRSAAAGRLEAFKQ
eukprot:9196820-Pyramimonas_sp.AAC.1